MSAGGLARLGVRCADASTGIATIGVFCGDLTELDDRQETTGGQSKPMYGNRALAMREDNDIVAMVEAYFNRHKH